MWIVDAVESSGVIGIDFEVGHSVSIPIPIAIPIPNMSISGLPRNGIRLTETHYVQTEHINDNHYDRPKT
ncbi:hypothetical protein D3OALGA1CA_1904 [Olavius algarvensis associated proteobacterium Delta 3]|nr:hypothetical protein D3OALGA1CA_1904 [Olavius algarvensis associated proteobacterium Delta 3]